jgi:hypothetical protein
MLVNDREAGITPFLPRGTPRSQRMLVEAEPRSLRQTIAIAAAPGTCPLCPLPIASGELVRRDALNRWVHVRCDSSPVAG